MSRVTGRRRHGREPLRSERGQALVEFALILPIFLLLVLGVIDIGKAVSYWNDETHLASEAARYAAVNSCTSCGAQKINAWILTQAETNELGAGAVVNISFPDGAAKHCVGDSVKVTLNYDYPVLNALHFLGFKGAGFNKISLKLSASSTQRLEQNFINDGSDKYTVVPAASGVNSC